MVSTFYDTTLIFAYWQRKRKIIGNNKQLYFCQNQSLAVYALFVIVIPFGGGKPQDSEKPVLVCADLLPYRHGLIHIAMCRWELSAASRRQKEAKNQFWSVQTYYLTVKTQSTLLFTAP